MDASNRLIVLSDTTKRWLLDQRRPELNIDNGATFTGMSVSNRPSLLSQTRTESKVAVAIRSPCGEYFAALTQYSWSVNTFLRAATSQMAVGFFDAVTSRVESGEKSTPRIESGRSSLCVKTCSNVFVSHKIASPQSVPAAIHLPSCETARERTSRAAIVAICLQSSTRHTLCPSPPPTIYSPFAVNVTARILLPTLISMTGERSCPTVSINANSFHQYAPLIVDEVVIRNTVAEQW